MLPKTQQYARSSHDSPRICVRRIRGARHGTLACARAREGMDARRGSQDLHVTYLFFSLSRPTVEHVSRGIHGPRDCICNHTFYPRPAAAIADASPGTLSKLSIATPCTLLSCASIGATPVKLVVHFRSMRASGGIPGVSSGGTHTSSHTASNPPAVVYCCSTSVSSKRVWDTYRRERHLRRRLPSIRSH